MKTQPQFTTHDLNQELNLIVTQSSKINSNTSGIDLEPIQASHTSQEESFPRDNARISVPNAKPSTPLKRKVFNIDTISPFSFLTPPTEFYKPQESLPTSTDTKVAPGLNHLSSPELYNAYQKLSPLDKIKVIVDSPKLTIDDFAESDNQSKKEQSKKFTLTYNHRAYKDSKKSNLYRIYKQSIDFEQLEQIKLIIISLNFIIIFPIHVKIFSLLTYENVEMHPLFNIFRHPISVLPMIMLTSLISIFLFIAFIVLKTEIKSRIKYFLHMRKKQKELKI